MSRNLRNGVCRVCETYFVGMDKWEYNWHVSRHIREEHPQYDATKVMESLWSKH